MVNVSQISKRRRSTISIIAVCSTLIGLLGFSVVKSLGAYAIGPDDTPSVLDAQGMWDAQYTEGRVNPEFDAAGYSRALFPHWGQIGGCSIKQLVIQRDKETGTDTGCTVTNGSWTSWYDLQFIQDPSLLEVDHIVALHEAWRSGADEWDTEQRRVFANDMTTNLMAVSATSNNAKRDKDPKDFMPAFSPCEYLVWWVNVKNKYGLDADIGEWNFVDQRLAAC